MSRIAVKSLFSIGGALVRSPRHHYGQFCECLLNQQSFVTPFQLHLVRYLSAHKITNNLELTTIDDKIQVDQKSLTVQANTKRPLAVILGWIGAEKKHVQKFSDLYLNSGCDVLLVPSTALQCLFPVNGSQMVAESLLRFLAANPSYKKVLVHGFSVGGYLWGEVCLKIQKYPSVPEQLTAQVWDSLVDVIGAGNGVAAAIFPKNVVLRKIVRSMVKFHLWLFQNIATKHYRASSNCFYDPPVKVPAIMFLSRKDAICSFQESLDVAESWRRHVKVTVKIWDDSPHVGHFRMHTEEYINELNTYLQSIKMPVVHKV